MTIFNGTGQTLDGIAFTASYQAVQPPGVAGTWNSETAEQIIIDSFVGVNPVDGFPPSPIFASFECNGHGAKRECALPSADVYEMEFGFGPLAAGESRIFELHLALSGFVYAVPEPATGMMLVGSIVALHALRRRRR